MRFSMLVSVLRPIGPVVIGISLGFTLSLLSINWVEESCFMEGKDSEIDLSPDDRALKGARKPNSISAGSDGDSEEDIEPRIVPYKPVKQSASKKLFRAKYISTELGMRERLFVGVLTSQGSLSTLGVAVNRTASPHLDALVFFMGARGHAPPRGMTVVSHGDVEERPVRSMFQTLRHIGQRHVDAYDWFFLVPDRTYTQADRVRAAVDRLSANRPLYLGRPRPLEGGGAGGRYCHGAAGFLLSRALLLQLQEHLEACRHDDGDDMGARADEWLGRCIVAHTGISCVQQDQGVQYQDYELAKASDAMEEESEQFTDAMTVHPVSEPEHMYRLHRRFTQIELRRTYDEITKLQAEIRNVSTVAFDGNRSAQWPVGVSPPFEPQNRWEVLRWDYFTEDHLYSCADGAPRCPLLGADRLDVADVVAVATAELSKRCEPASMQLVNGYRRFDPTRGMEYTLDLRLELAARDGRETRHLDKRVHLLRPLSRVEIIPMPYVTEATRVHVMVPLTPQDRADAGRFLDDFAAAAFAPGDNVVLTFLFVYGPLEAQRVHRDDVFAGIKAQIGACERRYPAVKIPWVSVKTESPWQLKLMDVLARKHPVDTLFLLATPHTGVTADFLNRCRMNAIAGRQVFFPVHFQDYSPAVARGDQAVPGELARDAGRFDRSAADEACFYNSDYAAVRARMAQDSEEPPEALDLYDAFVRYSPLHVFRAVEPALRQRYRYRACDPRLAEDVYHRCLHGNLEGLGSRAQLATLLLEQEQGNST